jgi:histidinol dehydrogenase
MMASGADEIYALGGAQAIGALAYGTETIRPVDMIVGPGNQYVAEAKRQVFGTVGIDLIAGPSEVMVIADENAKPDWVAADILAQCEHDTQARGALITTSRPMAEAVLREIERQLQLLSTAEVARQSWADNGEVILVDNLEEAAKAANEWAPEHLEVHIADPKRLLPLLQNYGSLFLGEEAAEVFADKLAGTNHILPTLRSARYTGGLWVGMFLKCVTHQWCITETMDYMAPIVVRQATYEGMDAHRAAAAIRIHQAS